MNKKTKLIAFAGTKGGIGKTTFTVTCASSLHYCTDNNIIVCDADFPQHSIKAMRQRDIEKVNNSDYYKRLAYTQFTTIQKRAYPIVSAKPDIIVAELLKDINTANEEIDAAFIDLPGTAGNDGVLQTIAELNYLFIPIVADYVTLDSCLKFASVINDNLIIPGYSKAQMFLFWNMVNSHERTDLYDLYNQIIADLGLQLLTTRIPDAVRFKKEILTDRKTVFRSTLFPPSKNMLAGSQIDNLISEIRMITGL